MKLTALTLTSVFLLTGCASVLPDEQDAAACQELANIVSIENATLDSLTPAAIGEKLRAEISPLAGETLAGRVDALAAALEAPELDTGAAGAAASEIGVRCALSGVTFDFTGIGQLLN